MPRTLRLTRRFPVAITEEAHRQLRRFSTESGLSPDEALSFLFENFGSVTHGPNLGHRLNLFRAALERDPPPP